MNIKSAESKTVLKYYKEIIAVFGNEVNLWRETKQKAIENLPKKLPEEIKSSILAIKDDKFSFFPLGFDGTYGSLVLGKKQNYFGHSVINK